MKRLHKFAASLLAIPALAFSSTVYATAAGQIEGGDIYRIKNLTKNVDFTDPAQADACNELMYKVRIHNPGPSPVTEVNVRATLPGGSATSHTSTVTIFSPTAFPHTTTDTATLNLSSSQSLSYVSGSTQLLDAHNGFISNLPDGITSGSGVSIGTVGVSIEQKRFVQFKVKVNCPEVPKPVAKCDLLSATVGQNRKVDASVTYTALNGATLKNVNWSWGDGKSENTGTTTSASHTYAADGSYTITTALTFNVGEGVVSSSCSTKVTITTPVTPVVQPAQIVPTGPGSVVGLFAGVSAVAGIGHYLFRRARS